MIKAPRHDFAITGTDPPAHEVIATPELQAWADAAAQRLAAGGWHVPADLEVVRAGQPLTRHRWHWLLYAVESPRPECPF